MYNANEMKYSINYFGNVINKLLQLSFVNFKPNKLLFKQEKMKIQLVYDAFRKC